jgi:hypothetical protein
MIVCHNISTQPLVEMLKQTPKCLQYWSANTGPAFIATKDHGVQQLQKQQANYGTSSHTSKKIGRQNASTTYQRKPGDQSSTIPPITDTTKPNQQLITHNKWTPE